MLDFKTWFDKVVDELVKRGWDRIIDQDDLRDDFENGELPEDAASNFLDLNDHLG